MEKVQRYLNRISFDNTDIINAVKNLRLDKIQNEKSYKRIK